MRAVLLTCFILFIAGSSFMQAEPIKLKLPKEFVRIPAGSFSMDADGKELIRTEGFYMQKYEISNKQYRTFLDDVAREMGPAMKASLEIDATGWKHVIKENAPMEKYNTHSAFDDFPVVNVSYEGALAYCKWVQQKINDLNPGYDIEVKLPTKEEWIWAAMGGRSQAMFPWANYYLRNKKGEPMCNYKRVNDAQIYRDRQTGKPAVAEALFASSGHITYTAHVHSFYPNDYDLYNMCGNAAEMIATKGISMGGSWNDYGGDVRIRAESRYERSSATVGFRPIIRIKEK